MNNRQKRPESLGEKQAAGEDEDCHSTYPKQCAIESLNTGDVEDLH